MKRKIIYIAENGEEFNSETECKEYESRIKKEKNIAVQAAIRELNEKIWNKFYPDYVGEKLPDSNAANIWLRNDIESILTDENINAKNAEEYIFTLIRKHKYGNEILSEYINHNDVVETAAIRKDFCNAFRTEKDISDIAEKLHYSFASSDLKKLAILHKSNIFRKKIEELLTYCNFHYECAKFLSNEYDEFL